MLVKLELISVALSWVMAETRHSPILSPTNSILPAIIAAGFLRLKTMPCSFSGSGFGGASFSGGAEETPGRGSREGEAGCGVDGIAAGAFRSIEAEDAGDDFAGAER